MRKTSLALVLWLAAQALSVAQDPQKPLTVTGSIEKTLGYLLYTPKEYETDAAKKWPLVVFLHGIGERGNNLDAVKRHGPPKLIAAGKEFPFLVASPQCPPDRWWEPDALLILIQDLEKNYRIDPDRIYLTGLSMGGFGTWATASAYPNKFAAIAPVCGGGNDLMAGRQLGKMPTWCFHGAKDTAVILEQSQRMVNALEAAKNPEVKFTIYPDAGHDCWTVTYENDELYTWLLTHVRGQK